MFTLDINKTTLSAGRGSQSWSLAQLLGLHTEIWQAVTCSLYSSATSLQSYDMSSVGIDLKELGDQLPKCLKFCPGIEV